jgi:DNA polymerase I-like protein with 3'-5' exonuclease and polymerase domains
MAAPGWLRRLIAPQIGHGLALLDWSTQEFGIAAALSGDQRMVADYHLGDPYQALADRYGGDRAISKACALGVLNGIGASGLARQIGRDVGEARLLLREHRAEYPSFWLWSDGVESHAFLHGMLQSTYGWRIAVTADSNPRFLRNFPLQANAAEMLRLACCLATERGVTVCAPNHDALLIEAHLDNLADAVELARAAMTEASQIVLDGFRLRTSVTIIQHPQHYPHPKSDALWSDIERCLADLGECTAPVHERNASCSQANARPISLYVLNRKDQSDDVD